MSKMYNRRFRNRTGYRLFNLKGRFSIMYLGGGTFLYSVPGKNYPVVRKLELGRKKYRTQGASVLFLGMFFFGAVSLMTNAGTADSIDSEELERLEANLTPIELEEKSEELKSRILEVGKVETAATTDGKKAKVLSYTVKNGDTVTRIAAKHKIPARMIYESSDLKPGAVIRVGQVLKIPDRPGLMYKMKPGDTLAAVADKYSVKLAAVMTDNPDLADLDMLESGDRVFLPDAKIPEPPKPKLPSWVIPGYGRVTSNFGWRRHPFNGRRHMHTGTDIGLRYGAVRAAREGRVKFAGYMGSYGRAIVIEHPGGWKTLYAHLSKIRVRAGQAVAKGQSIAVSGNTGLSTGPHLHFELYRNGRVVNPRRYLRF